MVVHDHGENQSAESPAYFETLREMIQAGNGIIPRSEV